MVTSSCVFHCHVVLYKSRIWRKWFLEKIGHEGCHLSLLFSFHMLQTKCFWVLRFFSEDSFMHLSRVQGLFGRTLLYGYELLPFFPPQTLIIVPMSGIHWVWWWWCYNYLSNSFVLCSHLVGLNNLLMAYEDKSAYAMCVFSLSLGPSADPVTFVGKTMVCFYFLICFSFKSYSYVLNFEQGVEQDHNIILEYKKKKW